MITLELPWPISINHYYSVRAGKRYLKRAAKTFRKTVGMLVAGAGHPYIDGDLLLSVELHPPHNRRYDGDNFLKGIQDSLQHAKVYKDDTQIQELHVYKCRKDSNDRGYAIVEIEQRGGTVEDD